MKTRISVGLAAALMLAASPAFACKGSKVLFSDDFKQVDSSWGFDSPDVQVEEGKVKVKPQPDISNLLVYKGILFGDADYCLTRADTQSAIGPRQYHGGSDLLGQGLRQLLHVHDNAERLR